MRLDWINNQKKLNAPLQSLWPARASDSSYYKFRIFPHDRIKRIIGRAIAPLLCPLINVFSKHRCFFKIPFPYNTLLIGERWSLDLSLAKLLSCLHKQKTSKNILIVGCGRGGEDVQFWLRHGSNKIHGIDIDHDLRWDTEIIPTLKKKFKRDVTFVQSAVEKLPFADESFDLVTSTAVLEHVRDPLHAIQEISRVTKVGGYSWHTIGPLYFCYSGDHGICAYGHDHGYDHLLKNEEEYRSMINNFGKKETDRYFFGWAAMNQFSYYTPEEYIRLFEKYFVIENLVLIISPEGLSFRKKFPSRWEELKKAGLEDVDLLTKSILVILKKTTQPKKDI